MIYQSVISLSQSLIVPPRRAISPLPLPSPHLKIILCLNLPLTQLIPLKGNAAVSPVIKTPGCMDFMPFPSRLMIWTLSRRTSWRAAFSRMLPSSVPNCVPSFSTPPSTAVPSTMPLACSPGSMRRNFVLTNRIPASSSVFFGRSLKPVPSSPTVKTASQTLPQNESSVTYQLNSHLSPKSTPEKPSIINFGFLQPIRILYSLGQVSAARCP